MKVFFDYHAFSLQKYGGISRYFVELNREFCQSKIESKIIAPIHKNYYLKNSKFNFKTNIYLNRYPRFTNKLISNYNFFLTNLMIKYYNPNIIHQTYYANKSLFINKKKTKNVLTVYDLIHEIFYNDFGFEKKYRPKQYSLDNSDHVICISNKTKLDLMNIYKIPEEKITVVHLGYTKLKNLKKEDIINEPYLLFVGSRKRYKNFNNFIRGYSLSTSLKKDFKLVCFGGEKFDAKEFKILKEFGADINQIIHISGDDQVLSNLYENAQAFIFPSLYEGFGLPIIEAMSYHCPVLLSSIDVFKEIAENSACYFEPNSPESIKDAIEKLVYSESKKNDLKNKGFELIKKFTWESCSKKTLKIYNKII